MLCPARLLATALGFANANDLLETRPKCFREKSKQLLLEDINMQLGHKIKEATMSALQCNHLFQQLMDSISREEAFWHWLPGAACLIMTPARH